MTGATRRRHRCQCSCDCDSTAHVSVMACPSCSIGIHKPLEAVREHLRQGLYEWTRLLRPTGAYVTEQQTNQAADAWAIWHQSRPCPVPR